MAVRTEVAPEACNSSPGNANLRIGTQAGHDEDSHPNPQRKYALRRTLSVIPAYAAVMSSLRRHAHPPASFLRRQESKREFLFIRVVLLLTTTRQYHQDIPHTGSVTSYVS